MDGVSSFLGVSLDLEALVAFLEEDGVAAEVFSVFDFFAGVDDLATSCVFKDASDFLDVEVGVSALVEALAGVLLLEAVDFVGVSVVDLEPSAGADLAVLEGVDAVLVVLVDLEVDAGVEVVFSSTLLDSETFFFGVALPLVSMWTFFGDGASKAEGAARLPVGVSEVSPDFSSRSLDGGGVKLLYTGNGAQPVEMRAICFTLAQPRGSRWTTASMEAMKFWHNSASVKPVSPIL